MTIAEQLPSAPTAPVVKSSPGFSIAAILSFAGGITLLVLHMTVRLLAIYSSGWPEWIPNTIGILGLLSILPILVNIVLGHVGARSAKTKGKGGRALGVAGATIGYVLLVLYFNRLLVILLGATQYGTQYGDWSYFSQYFFQSVVWYA